MARATSAFLCLCALHALPTGQEARGDSPLSVAETEYRTWTSYAGDPGHSRYSSLDQINADNVNRLQLIWRYDAGDAESAGSQIQCNPIVVDGVLFGTTSKLKVFALNAATGEELWRFDPYAGSISGQGINRGVSHWQSGDDQRVLFTAGPYLYALNAGTGKPVIAFGEAGRVDLRLGLGRSPETLQIDVTTPGAIYRNLIVLGSRVGETPRAAPGHIRAFDIRTGDLIWVFHTIPQPGEFGYDTWPRDAWQRVGGANAWGGMSLDAARGLVFAPTGSPAFDFYGGNRHGDNLFANSVVALDATTGKRRWHFQTVHHDLWDRDLPAAPNLVTVHRDNARIDAVAQVTKSGFIFVLHRETGEPIFPVEERPVPASNVVGERASPTQPVPSKPPSLTRQQFTPAEVTDRSLEVQAEVLERLKTMRTGHSFLPPTLEQPTVLFPGFDGGAEWGGAAYDPTTGHLYVNATELPWSFTLVELEETGVPGGGVYVDYCASCHGLDRQGNGRDYPSLLGVGERLSYPIVAGIIRNGLGRMPGFPQLGLEDILLLLDFLNEPAEILLPTATGKPPDETFAAEARFLHTGYFRFLDSDGYPAIKPPWGTLSAVDLNKGDIVWQVPLGEYPELVKQGLRHTGTENYGGPIVTAGGLIFIGATMDEKFRAFDKATGEILWETNLPAGGFATPATYEVAGQQYLVIAAGGGKSGLKSGGEYLAFGLADQESAP